jgi:hypothetical protein
VPARMCLSDQPVLSGRGAAAPKPWLHGKNSTGSYTVGRARTAGRVLLNVNVLALIGNRRDSCFGGGSAALTAEPGDA